MVDPGTAMLIATAVAAGAKGAEGYFSGKKNKKIAKEKKRETRANILHDAMQRSAEQEEQRLKSKKKLTQRKSQSFQDTADLVRGAFNI